MIQFGNMVKKLPKILVVCGPTASGKTGIGIALAKRFGGEVLASDSRTVYRNMEIGVAKPPADVSPPPCQGGVGGGVAGSMPIDVLFSSRPRLVESVPHWGFDLVDPDEPFTVSQYQEYADKKIAEILERGNVPIVVGGTGLYIRAILDRPNFAGAAPDAALRAELDAMSDNDLLEEIAARDPDAVAAIDDRNRRRLVRALEILRTTGGTLAEHQEFGSPMYDAFQIGIDVPREELYARIDQRVDEMIGHGLVDEVRKLLEQYGPESQAMTGIGYRQIADFFAKKESLRDAVKRIKYDTHHYAKRQETWFRRDSRILWVRSPAEAVHAAESFLLDV
jgi:tRNA dimethylallyltransferase